MPEISELFDQISRLLPTLQWSGTYNSTPVTVTKVIAGVDLSRGPWVKFFYVIETDNEAVQGYWLHRGQERVKRNGTIELDRDDIRVRVENGFVFELSGTHDGNDCRWSFVATP